jgi:hypothetical protein
VHKCNTLEHTPNSHVRRLNPSSRPPTPNREDGASTREKASISSGTLSVQLPPISSTFDEDYSSISTPNPQIQPSDAIEITGAETIGGLRSTATHNSSIGEESASSEIMERPEYLQKATEYMQLYAESFMQDGQAKIKSLENTTKSLRAALDGVTGQLVYFKQMADSMTNRMDHIQALCLARESDSPARIFQANALTDAKSILMRFLESGR